jgi:hypothetical protein
MRAVERSYQPISLEPALDDTQLEIRIHGDKPQGDQPALLTPREARLLAYALLAQAETLEPK